jgi:paraquat-inducible protein B
VTFSVDPQSVNISDLPRPQGADQRETTREWLRTLVSHGLRAQVIEVSFLTGLKLIALDMSRNAPPGHMERVGQNEKIPSMSSGDLAQILEQVRGVLQNLERATGGPELKHSLRALDETLTHLDQVTRDVQPDLKALIRSLRETAEAAQSTLNSVQTTLGSNSAAGSDLPQLMRELTQAARAVRGLADYLDRHPEALLRGRRETEQ